VKVALHSGGHFARPEKTTSFKAVSRGPKEGRSGFFLLVVWVGFAQKGNRRNWRFGGRFDSRPIRLFAELMRRPGRAGLLVVFSTAEKNGL